jgi:hypothetical protein
MNSESVFTIIHSGYSEGVSFFYFPRLYDQERYLGRNPKTVDDGGKKMFRQNMGRLDRTLRFIVGLALIPIGLLALSGWQGNLTGVLVATFALLPLLTSLTGFCPGYIPFGISTCDTEQNPTKLSWHKDMEISTK